MLNNQKLKILGSNHFKGKQEITEISINGTATFHKDVQTEIFDILGRCRLKAPVQAERFVNKGSCSVEGKLTCNKLINIGQGSFHIIDADSIESSGSLVVNESILCHTFQSTGYLKIKEKLIGDQVSIEVSVPSKVREISGKDEVAIKSAKTTLFNVLSLFRRKMIAYSIQGKNVYLEHTEACKVSGEIVKIGINCKVEEVLYKRDLKVHPSSIVSKSTKI